MPAATIFPFIKIMLIAIVAFALGFLTRHYWSFNNGSLVPTTSYETAAVEKNVTHENTFSSASKTQENIMVVNASVSSKEADKVDSFSWDRVNQLIANARYEDAILLLQAQFDNPKNVAQAWYVLASIYKKQELPSAVLDALFRYLKLENNSQKIDRALADIKSYLVQLRSKPALFNEDYSWLIAQFDALLKYTPNDGDLHVMMAKLYIKLGDNYQAQYHALMGVNDPNVQSQAEEVLADLSGEKLAEDIAIPLVMTGNKYIVNASVEGNPVRLLLDTGASLSGLSGSYIAKYPYLVKDKKLILLNTAGGSQPSYLFTVNNINIASLQFNKHILAQLPMGNMEGFDGLLGVDILGRFDFVIDQDASVLRVKARKK